MESIPALQGWLASRWSRRERQIHRAWQMLGWELLQVTRPGTHTRDLHLLGDTPGDVLSCPCGGWGRLDSSMSWLISRGRCQTSSSANRGSPGAAGKQQKLKITKFHSNAKK